MKEVWRKIPGYKDWYEVSNLGRLRSKYRGVKILKPSGDGKGYLKTTIIDVDGIHRAGRIHRLVAKAFIPNLENKPEVNHKDLDKSNNNVSNLEWNTSKENHSHAVINGRSGYKWGKGEKQHKNCIRKGSDNGFSILSENQVIEIRAKFKPRKYTRKMLAKEYGVKECTVKDIVLRKSWKHL